MGIFSEIAQTYRDSRKSQDILWNTYVARPLAAVLVAVLRRTPVTPNQVTILGAIVFFGVVAALVGWPGIGGLVAAAVILELAYILDCADGQLARVTGKTSPVGSYFDFLIDEVKALLLVGACAVRAWQSTSEEWWLVIGIAGCAIVSIATSLTNFVRRKEYAGVEIKPGASARVSGPPASIVGKAFWLLKRGLSYVAHYPSWFWILPLVDLHPLLEGEVVFLAAFLGVYTLYLGQTGLGVALKLGSPAFYKE